MKKIIYFCVLALAITLVNCGDKNSDPEPAKTLNKSLITDKKWVYGTISHYFRTDGRFGSATGVGLGKWYWINDSDSLMKDYDDNVLKDEVWYVEYVTDSEMKAKWTKKGSWDIFIKQ
ncbi:MAG: hypothetical protein H6605_09800 [Flavobacteriales bacterium]|nr:hypothetical protein [Flavobacteriales bacterium]